MRELVHVAQTKSVDLGGLHAFKGSQKYANLDGIDLTKFDHDINWSGQTKVLISSVDLKLT